MGAFQQTLGGLHLSEYQYVLAGGHPPVYIQLVIANVVLLAFWVMRRARGAHRQGGGGIIFAVLFLMANVGVIMYSQLGA